MVGMNLPGAQVAAVVRRLPRKTRSGGDYPDYGLAARFEVTVDELKLGRWLSCEGLGISFNPEELKSGGRYDEPVFAPGRLSWTEVTLSRAMDKTGHAAVERLLYNHTQSWVNWNGVSTDTLHQGQNVEITLLDRTGQDPIATWKLHGALIKSWSGPGLGGGKSEVALEKLVFAHSGFWGTAPALPKVKLEHEATKKFVEFDNFPDQYSVSQGIQTEDTSGVQIFQTESHVTNVNDRKIILNKLRVVGLGRVESFVNTLFEWLIPEKPSGAPAEKPADAGADAAAGAGAKDVPNKGAAPKLTLSLGSQRGIQQVAVNLREVKVDFTRFNTQGSPICAEIELTLIQIPLLNPFLNPTSGGRTANRAHLVSAGDNLQRIAQDTYHDPGAWRMIAATNEIDDPLRVRVGNTLLLPGTAQ